ncbi:MAG TPA: FAD-dependent oxidoreductase [Rhizomicrobium sp.]|jgi:pyruvate/2-oxoglutarate dehydrogenase complex dihydrolipoamide dehydrogenase (E3) component
MQIHASSRSRSRLRCDICVIGAGSAGLTVAAGAAQMGARTVLVEAGRMGGDCLNTGCVPSKALIAAAKVAQSLQAANRFTTQPSAANFEFRKVHAYVRGAIAKIAPHDSVEHFTALGCTVIKSQAHFLDRRTLEAGDRQIRARRFVIATGNRPAVPPIAGIADLPYFTNENLFENSSLPAHLLIIGAGPIGCEMAQAHRRLGSEVTVLDLGPILPKDDPEAAAAIRRVFQDEGIDLVERARITRAEARNSGVALALSGNGGERWIEGSHLLIATGRRPNLDDLRLDAAGVRYGKKGVEVDGRLRTTNRRIFAAGDVVGSYQFTHLAGYHATIVLRNALFHLPARVDLRVLPWVTFTDPELAQVGLTEAHARDIHGGGVRILRADFSDNGRAQTDDAAVGFLKVIAARRGKVLGATMVGPHAGELIQLWGFAIAQGLTIAATAKMIAPYPTLGEINRQAAGKFYAPILFGPRTRLLVRLLGLFG